MRKVVHLLPQGSKMTACGIVVPGLGARTAGPQTTIVPEWVSCGACLKAMQVQQTLPGVPPGGKRDWKE